MQAASQEYREEMRSGLRNQSYLRVTIGVINQEAQASAYLTQPEHYTYYSNLTKPMDNYSVTEHYAACDPDYTTTDGRMYFMPRSASDVVLNQGIVSEELLGTIEFSFPLPCDLRGLTLEFGSAYPVDFRIESDHNTVEITGNESGYFVTEEIFSETTFLRLIPLKMKNGRSRFRLHRITMGIGIYFDNRKILSATKKERISPIMEDLPAIDLSVKVNNKDRAFDIENEESTVNFLEPGQKVEVHYGYELDNGRTEWMPGASLNLKEWSADDEEMEFSASDRFDSMEGTYDKGKYYETGISLYDLASDVFSDAGVDSREYWIDPYLKDVKVKNPMPNVSHKEALQLIANAGRCLLYQDRTGNLFMKSSFIPEMEASSDNETYFSDAGNVLSGNRKASYGLAAWNYTDTDKNRYFLPRESEDAVFLHTGYISQMTAGEDGSFAENPRLEIALEAAYKCFGLTLEFGWNHPKEMTFHTYYNGEKKEDYSVSDLTDVTVINHEFPEFDRLVLEFTKGTPYNRVILNRLIFGDSTDYEFAYGTELTKTPKGTQLSKVREVQVVRTVYGRSDEVKELVKETLTIGPDARQHTFYFGNASYDLSAVVMEETKETGEMKETGEKNSGLSVKIIDSSAYYAVVEICSLEEAEEQTAEVAISGREYLTTQSNVSRQLNPTGLIEVWENPLVSETEHAKDLAGWIGDYLAADREYDLTYRGEPRIDANDIAFLENKYIPDMLIRIYEHTLKFNGALSGTVKARRDMSGLVRTKNRLDSRWLV